MHIFELVIIVVVIVGIVIAIFGWDRYRGSRENHGGNGASQPTSEVFLDSETGRRTRVWYDPKTGQRDYRPE